MGSWAPPLHLPFHNMYIDIMKKHDYWFLAPPHAPSNIPSVWESNGPHRTIIWSAGLPISNPPPTLLLGVSPRSSYIITLLISSFFAAQSERVFLLLIIRTCCDRTPHSHVGPNKSNHLSFCIAKCCGAYYKD